MELIYEGKKDFNAIGKLIALQSASAPLIPLMPVGCLIYGDNFPVMSRMLANYQGKFDLIYIDPPFNTQSNFYASQERVAHISHSYSDHLAYADKLGFEEYLEYIRERLHLLSHLLSPQGTLYIHIDIKVGHYLKIILDEILGKQCFINEITRIKSNPKNFQRKAYGNQKDVIYVYVKAPGQNIFNNIKEKPNDRELLRLYPKKDASGRQYTTVPCHAPGETKNGATGGQWRGLLPPPGRHWRCAPEELEELDSQDLIEWSSNNVPRIKKFADQYEGKKIQDVWTEFKDPQYPIYPTEKNIAMLEQIVKQASNPNSLVLDCFCGSGAFLAAALRHGRRAIGIDSSRVAIEAAMKRPELVRIPLLDYPVKNKPVDLL